MYMPFLTLKPMSVVRSSKQVVHNNFNNNKISLLQNQHCVLNIHMEAVERLHQNQIYPIVLLVKFKSVKQIKEIKDPRYLAEKISQKDAKNMFESTLSLETDYKPYISGKCNTIYV